MTTQVEPRTAPSSVKRYAIQHPVSAYTFSKQARIELVRFERDYLHVHLEDGRILSIPLFWIPTLEDASAQDREQYELNRDRTMVVWDPAKCGINDELRLEDYLSSG